MIKVRLEFEVADRNELEVILDKTKAVIKFDDLKLLLIKVKKGGNSTQKADNLDEDWPY